MTRRPTLLAAFLCALAVACADDKPSCSGGEACRASDGGCMSCDAPYSCNSGGTCSASVKGVACCNGTGGGGGGNGCAAATPCWSNGVCCPTSARYGCNGYCYATTALANQAGCSGVVSQCP